MLAKSASIELRRKQLEWNKSSSTLSVKLLLKMVPLFFNFNRQSGQAQVSTHNRITQGSMISDTEYADIDIPVLLIGGAEDIITPVQTQLDELFRIIQRGGRCPRVRKHVMSNCGHNMMLEMPRACNVIVSSFLKSEDVMIESATFKSNLPSDSTIYSV